MHSRNRVYLVVWVCLVGGLLEILLLTEPSSPGEAEPAEVSLPESGVAGEPHMEDQTNSSGLWKNLQTILPSARERRLAYLFYHCGLKPSEIVRFCPQEWSDVQEIYHLRRNILAQVLRHADQFPGWPNDWEP